MNFRIFTPARLHWGLLRPVPKADGSRAFGGMGLTLESPGVVLDVQNRAEWDFGGILAPRAEAFAQRYLEACKDEGLSVTPPLRLEVVAAPWEHCGLGSGTQLALAVALALAKVSGHPETVGPLAAKTGRALRSSLGCQAFQRGGLLLDPGHPPGGLPFQPEEAECRVEFPIDWPILVVLPEEPGSWHGNREKGAFERLESTDRDSESMEDLARHQIIPAARSRDFRTLSKAVHSFNLLAGNAFAKVQGGPYSSPRIAGAIDRLRKLGIAGCGQSSWGPTVFGIVEDEDRAKWVMEQMKEDFPYGIRITRGQNRGVRLEPVFPTGHQEIGRNTLQ